MDNGDEKNNTTYVKGIKDNYIDQLHGDFQLVSEMVLSQIKLASDLVHDNNNKDIILLLKRNEKFINSLDVTIKEKVINAIMLFTPRASDLRKLMAYHDMTISMERIGDLLQNIAFALEKIDFSMAGFEKYKKPIDKMFVQTDKMLKSALFAFTGVNNEMAYDTISMDDKVDKLERKIERKLAEDFQNEVQSVKSLVNIMNLNSISYYLERVGDKAVDIAESAVYVIEGIDIRHVKEPKKTNTEDKSGTE